MQWHIVNNIAQTVNFIYDYDLIVLLFVIMGQELGLVLAISVQWNLLLTRVLVKGSSRMLHFERLNFERLLWHWQLLQAVRNLKVCLNTLSCWQLRTRCRLSNLHLVQCLHGAWLVVIRMHAVLSLHSLHYVVCLWRCQRIIRCLELICIRRLVLNVWLNNHLGFLHHSWRTLATYWLLFFVFNQSR